MQREATFGWTGLVTCFDSFLLSSISGSKRTFQTFSNKDSTGVARLHWRAALITTIYIQIRSLGHGVVLVTLGKAFTVTSETSAWFQEKRQKASLGALCGERRTWVSRSLALHCVPLRRLSLSLELRQAQNASHSAGGIGM